MPFEKTELVSSSNEYETANSEALQSPSTDGLGLLTQDPFLSPSSSNSSEKENILSHESHFNPHRPTTQFSVLANPALDEQSTSDRSVSSIQIKLVKGGSGSVQEVGDELGTSAHCSIKRFVKLTQSTGLVDSISETEVPGIEENALGTVNSHGVGSTSPKPSNDLIDDHEVNAPTSRPVVIKPPNQGFYPDIQVESTVIHGSGHDMTMENREDGSQSDDSSSSSEDELLDERRRKRVARNQIRLEELGLQSIKSHTKRQSIRKRRAVNIKLKPDVCIDQGCILLSGAVHSNSERRDWSLKYPGREAEIRLLKGILSASIAQIDTDEVYVPPPIFISGPGGTGKTSIIRDAVQSFCSPRVASAYINCATLEPSSIETLVESAYQQIATTFKKQKHGRTSQMGVKAPKRSTLSRIQLNMESECVETIHGDLEDRIEQARSQVCQFDSNEHSSSDERPPDALMSIVDANQKVDHVKPSNRKGEGEHSRKANDSPTRHSSQSRAVKVVENQTQVHKPKNDCMGEDGRSIATTSSHGAPLAFARSIRPFVGEHGVGSAILILDCAERLMNMNPTLTNSAVKTNYLAQMLLLPKAMELNLTILVISRCSLLLNARIENAVQGEKSTASIKMAVRPIGIHFSAYSDNTTFETILMTSEHLPSYIGSIPETEFHRALFKSFVQSLVQAMRCVTRDVRDMLRVGRTLWLSFIEPLSPQNIEATLDAAKVLEIDQQKALLSFLGQRLVKLSRNVENMLFSARDDEELTVTVSELPYLSKCMLIASFICQNNKADKDRQLFAINANGKRRRQHQRHDDGEPESVAFASWDQQRLRMLRPRSIPLERMLTVFVSIVGLHHEQGKRLLVDETTESFLSSLGNSVFLETVGQLRAIGLLKELPTRDGNLSLSAPMYCCDLGRADAESVARSIGFPLEKYLI